MRRKRRRRPVAPTLWYHPDYRVPIEGLGLETRRADLAIWALAELGVVDPGHVIEPYRVAYSALAAVHTPEVLAALSDPAKLAPVFGASAAEIPTAQVARTIRLACGATLAASRRALAGAGPQVNLLGGFHHASPGKGGGFSVVNDIAVAVRALQAQGFVGQVGVLDLDAHPPDGTADCFAAELAAGPDDAGDLRVWIGSLSAVDWGVMPGVDEVVLPGADDGAYLYALDALLGRMPTCDLVYVLAGGDVLAADRFGGFNLTLDGARRRDFRVFRHLDGAPSVWLSAGGYNDDAWRVLANTVSVLALERRVKWPVDYDPLRARFSKVAQELQPPVDPDELFGDFDLAAALGMRIPGGPRLLDTYTPEWLEHALHRYGILRHIERLGYNRFRVCVERHEDGDRFRLFGHWDDTEHLLVESQLDRIRYKDERFLFVNWMTLRNPVAEFTAARARLPNQEVPGLGLARESGELLALMAQRLELAGVAVRPAAFHVAYTARYDFEFADPDRDARFRKLIKDLKPYSLADVTRAIDAGEVLLDGVPYDWEPDLMIARLEPVERKRVPFAGVFSWPEGAGREKGAS